MTLRASLLLAAALLASPLAARSAVAAQWAIDPAASHLTFSGTQTGTKFQGAFKTFSGSIDFDPADPAAAKVAITVNMASASTGDTQRDEALPQADWFDTGHFADATFTAQGFRKTATGYEAPGKLAIRGVSTDLTLPFTLTIEGGAAHAQGHVQVMRNAFGVGQGAWADEQYVAFAVDVDFDLVAHAR